MTVSESVKAFRNQMEGLVKEHAASMSAVTRRWDETAAAAEKGAAEQAEKAQKLVERIRERAGALKKEDDKRGVQEIGGFNEETRYADADPDVERFSQHLLARHREQRAEQEPAATTAQSAKQAGPAIPDVAARPEAARRPAEPSDAWNVQVGRFGRRNQPAEPPQATPKPQPKPEPRRQPVLDDDEDFENQSWLR